MKRCAALVVLVVLVALAACTRDTPSDPPVQLADPGPCTPVDVAAAPEVAPLLDELAHSFNDADASRLSPRECAFVRVQSVDSALATQHLFDRWPEPATVGPAPTVWVPASRAWPALLNQRLAAKKLPALAGAGTSLARSKLVVAMPAPVARALGWPAKKVTWGTLASVAQHPRGWAALGHPEWGTFRLGKAHPEHSTSGLLATIALAELGDTGSARALESSVIYYGMAPWRFLDNWFRLDRQRQPLSYVSAVITDERAVVAYNAGSANGVIPKDTDLKKPHTPLVGVVPAGGTPDYDFPMIVPEAAWVQPETRRAAKAFVAYARTADAVAKVTAAGLHPPAARDEKLSGFDTSAALEQWTQIRKPARVMLLFDVSDSMGDLSDHKNPDSPSKIVLAKRALRAALSEFEPDDEVGLRIFTTDVRPSASTSWADVVPIGRMARQRKALSRAISALTPLNGSPLYAATRDAFDSMVKRYDRERINAVVLLTDGYNEDDANDDRRALLASLHDPVRFFTISYSPDADLGTLRRIAQATNASMYDATDPQLVDEMINAAFANF